LIGSWTMRWQNESKEEGGDYKTPTKKKAPPAPAPAQPKKAKREAAVKSFSCWWWCVSMWRVLVDGEFDHALAGSEGQDSREEAVGGEGRERGPAAFRGKVLHVLVSTECPVTSPLACSWGRERQGRGR